MKEISCCFIGHRKINRTEELTEKLKQTIKNLLNIGYIRFIFGSRSEFNSLCHSIVTEFKETYPNIIRVSYNTKSEASILEEKREELERSYSEILKREIQLEGFEEIIKDDKMYVSGKASYIERNQLMIDASDLCVFYFNKDYTPPVRNRSTKYPFGIWTSDKSGTAIAYKYAVQKKKQIINVFELV